MISEYFTEETQGNQISGCQRIEYFVYLIQDVLEHNKQDTTFNLTSILTSYISSLYLTYPIYKNISHLEYFSSV